ncbi:MAG: hypothetical protein Q9166_001136 [cf. Caloplaca sp. 2 TL-2023]
MVLIPYSTAYESPSRNISKQTLVDVMASTKTWARFLLRRLWPSETPPLLSTPSRIPAHVLVEEECLPRYDPSHFFPVRLGMSINDRYQIISKLGYGSQSTVWLVRDMWRWRWQANRFVSLKICANRPTARENAEHEITVYKRIATANPDHEGYEWVRKLLGSFEAAGPNGKHPCLVFEAMREPLWILLTHLTDETMSLELLKEWLKLVLQGLDYLHSECHIIHIDLKNDNIMFSIGNPAVLREYIHNQDDDPHLRKDANDRTIYVSRNEFGPLRSPLGRPKISDFGSAAWGDSAKPNRHMIQPDYFRAPEVTLGAEWSYSVDIWTLGVLV